MLKTLVQMMFTFSVALFLGNCSLENPMQTSSDVSGQPVRVASSPMVPDEVAAATDNAGITFCFARGTDGNIYYRYRTSGGSWTSLWLQKAGSFKGNIVIEKDKNNLLYVFAVGTDNLVKYCKQTSVGSTTFTSWVSTPWYAQLDGYIAATTSGTGSGKRIFLFTTFVNYNLICNKQNDDGTFGQWRPTLGSGELGIQTPKFAVYTGNAANYNVVIAASSGGILYKKQMWWSSTNPSFDSWSVLSSSANYTGEISMTSNNDGRLEVFASNPTNHCYGHSYQLTSGGSTWSAWEVLSQSSDYSCYNVSVTKNPDGRLETFFNGSSWNAMHQYQTAINSGWSTASFFENGQPTTGRHIATATYAEDGRLCIFVVASNWSVYYSVQHGVNQWWEQFVQFSNNF